MLSRGARVTETLRTPRRASLIKWIHACIHYVHHPYQDSLTMEALALLSDGAEVLGIVRQRPPRLALLADCIRRYEPITPTTARLRQGETWR